MRAMRSTKLVFIEGLPGSGKSTTARYVAARLDHSQHRVRLLQEVEPDHPLNVGGALHPAGATTGAALFARYTVTDYLAESLDRWRAFVADATEQDIIHVLDSYPYQNAARVLLQMDASIEVVRTYARELEQLSRPLAPVLVYLRSRPTPEALAAITTMRGAAWTAYAIEVITNCPYAHRRQLAGASGALAMLSAYADLVDQLLGDSSLPRLDLDTANGTWPSRYHRLDEFLSLG